ncbi:MAG: folate-binding protein YgfZ [Betaproteobacteria bacterium]|nr:folate-binding protein YgfZ [Betaproteobacteria bacterium]
MSQWPDLLAQQGARWQAERCFDFGAPPQEHRAAATGPVLAPLQSWATWRLSGPDAQSFLHNQTTSEVAALAPGALQLSGYCTPKGRLLATFTLWRRDPETFFALLPAKLAEEVFARLARYVLRAKVKIAPAPMVALGLGAVGAEAALAAAGFTVPAVGKTARDADTELLALSPRRFVLLTEAPSAAALWQRLRVQATSVGEPVWDALAIAEGIATVLPETQEEFVPQMLNLDLVGALSYTKGCYPGQEIVARMHYLGRLKERLYRAHVLTAPPQPGARLFSPVFGTQACGTVVLAGPSENGGSELLAVMQTAAATGEVRLATTDGPVLAFLPLPYAVPE